MAVDGVFAIALVCHEPEALIGFLVVFEHKIFAAFNFQDFQISFPDLVDDGFHPGRFSRLFF